MGLTRSICSIALRHVVSHRVPPLSFRYRNRTSSRYQRPKSSRRTHRQRLCLHCPYLSLRRVASKGIEGAPSSGSAREETYHWDRACAEMGFPDGDKQACRRLSTRDQTTQRRYRGLPALPCSVTWRCYLVELWCKVPAHAYTGQNMRLRCSGYGLEQRAGAFSVLEFPARYVARYGTECLVLY